MRANTYGFLLLAGIALSVSPVSVHAQTTSVFTVPEGVMTYSIPQDSVTYLSFPLTSDPSYSGAVSAVTATSISVADNPAPWTAGALAPPSSTTSSTVPYYVKFLSGAEMGRTIEVTANTTNTLTLDTTDGVGDEIDLTTSSFSVAAGDTFEVFPGDTLASIFGNNTSNPLLLTGGTNAGVADTVALYTTSASPVLTYYFNTNTNCWVPFQTTTNANNTPLPPYSALTIARRNGHPDTTISLTGRVAEVPALTKTVGKNTVFSSTNYATDMTLSLFNFGPNWVQNASVGLADTLAVYNPTEVPPRFDTYYQLPDGSWRNPQNPSIDVSTTVTISAGSFIAIGKHSLPSTVAGDLLESALPYSLNQ